MNPQVLWFEPQKKKKAKKIQHLISVRNLCIKSSKVIRVSKPLNVYFLRLKELSCGLKFLKNRGAEASWFCHLHYESFLILYFTLFSFPNSSTPGLMQTCPGPYHFQSIQRHLTFFIPTQLCRCVRC